MNEDTKIIATAAVEKIRKLLFELNDKRQINSDSETIESCLYAISRAAESARKIINYINREE